MTKQVEAIRSALGEALVQEFEVDVKAALCFVDAEWSLFAKPFRLEGVWVSVGQRRSASNCSRMGRSQART